MSVFDDKTTQHFGLCFLLLLFFLESFHWCVASSFSPPILPPVVLIFSSMISPLFFTRTRSESLFNYLILLIGGSYHHSVLALFDSLILWIPKVF